MGKADVGIYFLDVGQGDCTVIVPPEGEGAPILFDCADDLVATRFCHDHAITDLRAVIASHLDLDHIRGMLPFLREHFAAGRRVERLVVGPDREVREGENKNLRDLLAQAMAWEKAPPHAGFVVAPPFRNGDGPVEIAKGASWKVDLVLPWYGDTVGALLDGGEPNRCSAVLRVERGGTAVLIGADATLGSWERLDVGLRSARVIRTPHHGGEIREHGDQWKEFRDLYDAVTAETAVVSVGSNNGHDHPLPEHVTAARRGGACRVVCTQMTPQCHPQLLTLREKGLDLATAVEWPYRHRTSAGDSRRTPQRNEVPCAGSVVVWLEPAGDLKVVPEANGWHAQEMVGRAKSPLCLPQA